MSIFFWDNKVFFLFVSWAPRQWCAFLFLCTPIFWLKLPASFYRFLLCFFLYERNRETQNTGFVLFMALDIFFRVAAHNYDKNFRRALKLKIKLLRVRPWCANSVSLLPPIIMVSLLITRFLLPALCCTLLAYCSLLLSARCSMIGYYVL